MWTLAWWWMLAALPLPWLVRKGLDPEALDRDVTLRVPAAAEFRQLAAAGASARAPLPRLVGLSLIWLLVVLAAARPQHVGEPVTLPVTGRDLLLAVDLSGSMEERDFELDGRWVDRLTAIKALAGEFIERRVGDRIGLILFGREVYLQAPLTFDRATVRTLLNESAVGLAGRQTAIGDAIGLAIRTLDDAGVEEGRRVLVLLTDGANTAGAVEPMLAAELAAQRSMIIYPVGVGTDSATVRSLFGHRRPDPATDLDEPTLVAIAELTGGQYFRARDAEDFNRIYGLLDELEPSASEEDGFRPVTELFHWPLGAAFLLGTGWALLTVLGVSLSLRGRPGEGDG